MRFLLNAQLPPSLAARMSAAGHEALHVTDRLPAYASDLDIAREASVLDAVLMSEDRDFAILSARGVLQSQFLWVRSGNMTTRRLWALVGPLLPEAVRALEAGDRIVEIR